MDVVFDTADGDRKASHIIDDATDILENLFQVFRVDGDTSTLHVEDDMDVEFGVGVCHSVLFLRRD